MLKAPALASLALAFAVGNPCRAQDVRHDGNWWRSPLPAIQDGDLSKVATTLVKHSYLMGIGDGMHLGEMLTILGSPKDEPGVHVKTFDAGGRSFDYHWQRLHFETITTEQMSDGLDSFYNDYRNRSILVKDAIYVVALQISGDPDKEVGKITSSLRQKAQ